MRRLTGAPRPLSHLIMLVTAANRAALADAIEFQQDSPYKDLICGCLTSGGVGEKTFAEALDRVQDIGISDAEIDFYSDFYKEHSQSICVLPKGHSGRCRCSYEPFFGKKFANKIKDCHTAPGADDVIYKNRCKRTFPLQVEKRQETVLRNKYGLKQKVKLKAGIPLENAGTSFTVATAQFDFAALLTLQKDVEYVMPADIEVALMKHAKYLVQYYKSQGIFIEKKGYLCDPVLGVVLESEWYTIDDDRSPFQVQFGHVNPLRSDKFMTRGCNVLPITRRGNLIQSDTTLSEVKHFIKDAYEHTNQGRLPD